MAASEACAVFYVNEKKVKSVAAKLAANRNIHDITETFKLLGDPTRLKIIMALRETELCVCDLATLLDVTRSAISHQLRLLRTFRLVKFRREGKICFYSLSDFHIAKIIDITTEHTRE